MKRPGFTLVELMVAVTISSILVGATISIYSLFRRAIELDSERAQIAQNGRVAMDRLSREIRQSPDIVTNIPAIPVNLDDISANSPEIEFENGHIPDLTYHRYYISNNVLELDTKEYYFSGDPSTRVKAIATPPFGQSLVSHVISTQDIAERVQNIYFYGDDEIEIILQTMDTNNQTNQLRTLITRRN